MKIKKRIPGKWRLNWETKNAVAWTIVASHNFSEKHQQQKSTKVTLGVVDYLNWKPTTRRHLVKTNPVGLADKQISQDPPP